MRIKELNLIKYGKFQDRDIHFPGAPSDFHVIVGPNEAGKSTVRNAVADLLFGMKNVTPYAFLHGANELRLGGVVENEEGTAAFHRARGRSGTLRTPEDAKLSDDFLVPHLGAATREFFEQMFGLDHERLVQGGQSILDASDKLGQVLFESAAGIGVLGPVREAFEQRTAEIWATRRSSTEFAVAEAAFSQSSSDLKAAQVKSRDWQGRKERLDGICGELDQVREKVAELEAQRSKLERVKRLAPRLREMEEAQSGLESLGNVVELPTDALEVLHLAQREIAAAEATLSARTEEVADRTEQLQRLAVDEKTLALASEIEKLDRHRGACVNHPRDLPLREGEYTRSIRYALAAAAQLGWPAEEDALRTAMPTSLVTKTLNSLLRRHSGLEQALRNAQQAHLDAQRQLQELQKQLDEVPQSPDSPRLRQALAAARAFANFPSQRAGVAATVDGLRRKAESALAPLSTWGMSVEQLRRVNLPSVQRLSVLQKQALELQAAVQAARKAEEEALSELQRVTLQEAHFSENNRVVTATEVREARHRRDAVWTDVKSGVVTLETGAPTVDQAIRLADELVDTELGTAQSAAELQQLRQELQSANVVYQRRQGELEQREAAVEVARGEWVAIVSAAGLPGLALDDAQAWLAMRDSAVAAQDALEDKQAELDALERAAAEAQASLQGALREFTGAAVPESLSALIDAAQAEIDKWQRSDTTRASLTERVRDAQQAIPMAADKLAASRDSMDEWETQWRHSLQAANLGDAAATVASAEAALTVVETVTSNLAAAEDPKSRMQAMRNDLNLLKAMGEAIAVKLDLQLSDDEFEAAQGLVARLHAARETADAIKKVEEQLRQAKGKVQDAQATVYAAQARIAPLLEKAGVATLEQCIPLANASAQSRVYVAAREKARAELVQGGDGLSFEELTAELRAQNPDLVSALFEQTKQQLEQEGERRTHLLQRQIQAQQEFDAVNGQANAAVAEAKRQEALATLSDCAEQYVELVTAQRLLKWAVDRYRDQQQGPMLKRASEVFAGLTLGEFSRLVVDVDSNPPRLEAKRCTGKPVEVAGLSEGTRDQLFLALRIAALEMQVASRSAMPFVADDLFINFDDERARAGFAALKELSTKTQVLFLTHHEHLVPIIRDVFGTTVNVVELERATATAQEIQVV